MSYEQNGTAELCTGVPGLVSTLIGVWGHWSPKPGPRVRCKVPQQLAWGVGGGDVKFFWRNVEKAPWLESHRPLLPSHISDEAIYKSVHVPTSHETIYKSVHVPNVQNLRTDHPMSVIRGMQSQTMVSCGVGGTGCGSRTESGSHF